MTSDMNNARWMTRALRIAVGGALGIAFGLAVLAAVAPGSARAQDEEDEKKSSLWDIDKKILNGFMRGLGLRDGSESPQIEYRERSPLVIPPSKDLPQPQQAGAGQTPAWPSDPDVRRRKEAAKKRKETNYRGYDPDQEGRNLTPSELNPAGSPGATGGTGSTGTPNSMGNEGDPKRPSELGYFGGLFSSFGSIGKKEEYATFDREPTRDRLTAPPTGYQTPSSAQPYGISPKTDRPTASPWDRAVGN